MIGSAECQMWWGCADGGRGVSPTPEPSAASLQPQPIDGSITASLNGDCSVAGDVPGGGAACLTNTPAPASGTNHPAASVQSPATQAGSKHMLHASPTSRANQRQHAQASPCANYPGAVLPRKLLRSASEVLQEGSATPEQATGAGKCLAGPATPDQMPASAPVISSPCTPPRCSSLRRIAKASLACPAYKWRDVVNER